MSAIVVLRPGFLTTVQDLGRPGFACIGVGRAGAADPIALRLGNRLVGNDPGAPALELTLDGGSFLFDGDAIVAFSGADPLAHAGGAPLTSWRAHVIPSGTTIRCGSLRGGARAYLCVRGGIQVQPVLGSASTHLAAGFGGFEGRPLRAGDRLALGAAATRDPLPATIDPAGIPGYGDRTVFRAIDGPQSGWFDAEERNTFFGAPWRASESCDRMGIRLSGPAISRPGARELVTEGVPWGAVQVASGGQPIVLLVERPVTGGYPKIASVIAADLARLGQLRPRDPIRFERVPLTAAIAAFREQEESLASLGA